MLILVQYLVSILKSRTKSNYLLYFFASQSPPLRFYQL